MKKNNLHKKALSIIEVMVGIFIFALGISAIFMVITSTININNYNKNFIIASNLAREQIELIRNIRDTNYKKLQKWNTLDPSSDRYDIVFTGSSTVFYKLENRLPSLLNSTQFPITVSTGALLPNFKQALETNDVSKDPYRLCYDALKRYIYCTGILGEEETAFYRYIEVQKLTTKRVGGLEVPNALKIRSKVFWNQKGIYDTEVDTILTDWKRL